jgi:hypothetical protein
VIAETVFVQIQLNTVFIQMQDKVFPLNLALKCWRLSGSSEADRAKLNHSDLDHVEPNQGLHLKSSCVNKKENRA